MASEGESASCILLQWVVDTRRLWPSASKTADLSQAAAAVFELLPKDERDEVLRYVRVRDAKMAMASRLLKRYAIACFCDVGWTEATAVPDRNRKPVFRKADGSEPLIFNVTHQDGLVILFGMYQPPSGMAIGVDIVSPSERRDRDHETLLKEGWPAYVDIHADVFSPNEVIRLKSLPFDAKTEKGRDVLLRWFYALWCLREAYIKMTGEALLASWLRDLEIRGFAPPEDLDGGGVEGAWKHGQRVEAVDIKLEDLLDGYMVSSVVKRGDAGETAEVGEWRNFDLEEILTYVVGICSK